MYLQEKNYAVKQLGTKCASHTFSRLDEYLGNNDIPASMSTVIYVYE